MLPWNVGFPFDFWESVLFALRAQPWGILSMVSFLEAVGSKSCKPDRVTLSGTCV